MNYSPYPKARSALAVRKPDKMMKSRGDHTLDVATLLQKVSMNSAMLKLAAEDASLIHEM